MKTGTGQEERFIVIKVVTVYIIFGSLWTYLSDSILGLLVRDPDIIVRIATYKGLFFIIATAVLLYCLINYYVRRLVETREQIDADERELLSLLQSIPAGAAWADDRAVRYLYGSFTEQFGYTLDEIPTMKNWFVRAYPDEQYRREMTALWQEKTGESLAHGAPVRPIEARVSRKDGSECRIIINTELSSRRTLLIFTDITEREQHQKEFIRQQKLESIGVLAGGIAHVFNNVPTAIIGNLSFQCHKGH
jgi:PAS domain S-box-containing protein